MAGIPICDDPITRQLPKDYRQSRDIDQVRRAWHPILTREMGRHFEQIKEDVKAFLSAQTKMLSILTRFERDERAELIVREFVDDSLPGLLHLLSQISPGAQHQLPLRLTENTVVNDNETDARSFTMGPDPISPPPLFRPITSTSMGPPARTVAPLAPMTLATTRFDDHVSEAGPSSLQNAPHCFPEEEFPQNRRRPLNEAAEEPQSPGSPSKKARKEDGSQYLPPIKIVWRTIGFWEVEGTDYIFRDARCGPGWFIIRCNLSKQVGLNNPVHFKQHPLEGNLAMDHFGKNLACHDHTKKYTLEDIIREFGHRVKESGLEDEPEDGLEDVVEGGLTEERVTKANEKLRQRPEQPKVSARKRTKAKGKGKAADMGTGPQLPTNARAMTPGTDDSYRDEGS